MSSSRYCGRSHKFHQALSLVRLPSGETARRAAWSCRSLTDRLEPPAHLWNISINLVEICIIMLTLLYISTEFVDQITLLGFAILHRERQLFSSCSCGRFGCSRPATRIPNIYTFQSSRTNLQFSPVATTDLLRTMQDDSHRVQKVFIGWPRSTSAKDFEAQPRVRLRFPVD